MEPMESHDFLQQIKHHKQIKDNILEYQENY